MKQDSEVFSESLDKLEDEIGYYTTILIVPVGIVLNILTAVIFLRKGLNKTNMGFFYFWTSVLFAFTLIFYIFIHNSLIMFNYDLTLVNNTSCKIVTLLKRAIRNLPPWLLVLISIERYMHLKFKFNKNFKNKTLIFFSSFFLIVFLMLSFNITNLFYYLNNTKNSTLNTTNNSKCSTSSDLKFIAVLTAATFRSFIPVLFLVVLNWFIISKLIINTKQLKESKKKEAKMFRREYHFTFMTLVLSSFFVILNLPDAICHLVRNTYSSVNSQDTKTLAIIDFIWDTTYDASNFYYSSFFFINLLFNSIFRKELRLMCCFFNYFRFSEPEHSTGN